MDIRVSRTDDVATCFDIRRKVFVEDQQVPEEYEIDALDPQSDHYLIYVNGEAAGTARIYYFDKRARIGRFAVLSKYQRQGLGRQLMEHMLADIRKSGKVELMVLSSQVYAIPFYACFGFNVCSEEYMDANIPHKDMEMKLNSATR